MKIVYAFVDGDSFQETTSWHHRESVIAMATVYRLENTSEIVDGRLCLSSSPHISHDLATTDLTNFDLCDLVSHLRFFSKNTYLHLEKKLGAIRCFTYMHNYE